MYPKVMITGESSIRFQFGDTGKVDRETYRKVMSFAQFVEADRYFLLQEIVPTYHTATIYLKKPHNHMDEVVHRYLAIWQRYMKTEASSQGRTLCIPVCYDEEFSLDIERIMEYTSLSAQEIISRHTKPLYTVYMIGFLPGFPYLGELDERIATPRLKTPRTLVAKGSVGIGGLQTGIYPLDSPGGWNMIGRTPLDLFRLDRNEPFLLHAGDKLQFVPITMEDFCKIKRETEKHPDRVNEFIQR